MASLSKRKFWKELYLLEKFALNAMEYMSTLTELHQQNTDLDNEHLIFSWVKSRHFDICAIMEVYMLS